MLITNANLLPTGELNKAYSYALLVNSLSTPITFVVSSGALPPGMSLTVGGVLSGTPDHLGAYSFHILATDHLGATALASCTIFVIDVVSLASMSVDQVQFVQQFQQALASSGTWSTGLTTQTSQTLIELISAVGTFLTSRLIRVKEDAFPSSAQSDSAIRAIANMQGIRLARKLPATASATLTSIIDQTFPPYTQFSGGGYQWFITEQLTVVAGIPVSVVFKEGIVRSFSVAGLGTGLQAWVSADDNFTVSDQDVEVIINSTVLYKTFGGVWNYNGQQAFADGTLNDGRLLIQFGNQGFGAVPQVNDIISVTYAKTQGDAINGANIIGSRLTLAGNSDVGAVFTSNPSGGAAEKNAIAYRNFSSGTFGTYGSAVTKSQYSVTVNNYPGIVDAITQAQRDINTMDVRWMNVARVSALTNSVWSPAQIAEYVQYLQRQTMYPTRFLWQDPIPVPRTVSVAIYCFNSVSSLGAVQAVVANAIMKLFSARPGILLTNFYSSDLVTAAMEAAPGQISYVEVLAPGGPMLVTLPQSPILRTAVTVGGGTLVPSVYAYSVSVNAPGPLGGTDIGVPSNWAFPQVIATSDNSQVSMNWDAVYGASSYVVWGRIGGHIQQLATLGSGTLTWNDDGSIPDAPFSVAFPSPDSLIRYNTLASNNLTVLAKYADRQESIMFPVRDVIS